MNMSSFLFFSVLFHQQNFSYIKPRSVILLFDHLERKNPCWVHISASLDWRWSRRSFVVTNTFWSMSLRPRVFSRWATCSLSFSTIRSRSSISNVSSRHVWPERSWVSKDMFGTNFSIEWSLSPPGEMSWRRFFSIKASLHRSTPPLTSLVSERRSSVV